MKLKKSLAAGIIGAGNISPFHIRGYIQANVKLKAIVDIIKKRGEEKAQKYKIEKVFTDYKKMLIECPEIDVVSVCVPNYLHAQITIDCLNAGKHVLCEKPPALNGKQALEMKKTAEKKGKLLMFDFNNRARKDIQALMTHIKNGEIGRVNSAQAKWTRRHGIPGFGGWFTQKTLAGGGPVIDLLHMMDLALYFMEYPEPEWVLAQTFEDFSTNSDFKGPWGFPDVKEGKVDVETASHAFIKFRTGQVLFARTSWAEMNKFVENFGVALQGTKAGVKLSTLVETYGDDFMAAEANADNLCEIYTMEHGHPIDRKIKVDPDPKMGRELSINNFVNAVLGKEEPLNTPQQAVVLMKIIDALYKSAQTGKPVKID
jgi:predicted dehydrogenase